MSVILSGNSLGKPITDATAVSTDVANGKIFYNNNGKVYGTIPDIKRNNRKYTSNVRVDSGNHLTYIPDSDVILREGALHSATFQDIADVIGLTSDKLVSGNQVLGITGTTNSAVTESITLNNGTKFVHQTTVPKYTAGGCRIKGSTDSMSSAIGEKSVLIGTQSMKTSFFDTLEWNVSVDLSNLVKIVIIFTTNTYELRIPELEVSGYIYLDYNDIIVKGDQSYGNVHSRLMLHLGTTNLISIGIGIASSSSSTEIFEISSPVTIEVTHL